MSTKKEKRLVIGLGGKGGTGKTLHFRTLYYFLASSGAKVIGFDADIENPDFFTYHANSEHPVEPLDFLKTGDAKELFTLLAKESPDIVLVDMPGASGVGTREQLNKFGAFNIAEKLGYRITFDTVLNNQFNTIASLDQMLEYGGAKADYVAVKSQMWNQGSLTFKRWDKSATRKKFLELEGIEIEMPIFEATAFDAMHDLHLSFFDGAKLDFGDQVLIDSFLDLSRPELQRAAKYLGLPWETTGNGSGSTKTSKKKSTAATAPPAEQEPKVEVSSVSESS